ncbi:AraC family transcriptional regulator [Neobacillus mesonae]|nr:AraC family transcriptional regulator [Neobacillus mesonae]
MIAGDSMKDKQRGLAAYIEGYTGVDGTHRTEIPGLTFIRSSHVMDPIHTVHEPALCIIVQGTKIVMLNQEIYQYDTAHYLVVSVDLPISGQITQAESHAPYLCLRLDFSPAQILELITDTTEDQGHTSVSNKTSKGLWVSSMKEPLLDAVIRLVRLLSAAQDIHILAPLTIKEILYRLLQEEQGSMIRQIARPDSYSGRIAGVIELIKENYAETLRIDQLATAAHMSASSLHQHFKEITSMSPLQYQKQLRLLEARRLLMSGSVNAANAGFQVGYDSPSQFSREYNRLFGLPPVKDIKRLQDQTV